jgi:hypothetical protein
VAPSAATSDKATNPYKVSDGQSCVPGEIRVDNVAGVNYCFSVEYKSFPTIVDSDNDRVDDSLDDFPLDSACSNDAEGFEPNEGPRCFASWMAEQDDATQIKYIDNSTNSQIALTGPNWDYIVRYDLSETPPSYAVEASGTADNGDEFEFLAYLDNNRLYAVTVSGAFKYIGVADTSEVPLSALDIGDGQVENVIGAGSSLIVQVGQGLTAELRSYDAGGALQGSIGIDNVSLENAFYDSDESRLYFYLNDSNANYNVAYLAITGSSFSGSPVVATVFANSDVLTGQLAVLRYDVPNPDDPANPIEVERLFIPSGLSTALDLSDKNSLDQVAGFGSYDQLPYEQLLSVESEVNGNAELYLSGSRYETSQIVGLPNFSDTKANSIQAIVNATRSTGPVKRDYQFNAKTNDERVWSLVPFTKGDTAPNNEREAFVVQRDDDMVSISKLGLRDYDTDGISCIYERAFGLVEETNGDCASASLSDQKDIFDDPDGDTLVNIEEYTFLTNPRRADSDGDSWDDDYEVNRGTNPLDPLDF